MRGFLTILAAGLFGLCMACGSDEADTLEENLEGSKKIMEETYEAAREEGEGAVEAAGDAYEAVLEEGKKKAE